MDRFEQGFSDTEKAADSTVKSATDLARLARQLQKAAREGNIAAIKRTQDRLGDALSDLRQATSNAVHSWPFKEEQEEQYLRESYAAELRSVARERGLDLYERDGQLISHPSVVRVQPRDRSIRIDKKKASTIRPSYLVDILLQNQKKPARYPAQRFLGALHAVYSELVKEDATSDRLVRGRQARVIPLARVYKLFTSLPGSSRDYAPTDFARDLYLLETSGVTETSSGATVSFHASTGTRSTRGTFTFVGPDGQDVRYYGIRFTETS